MGGYGSGRWRLHDKRRTVDASIVLDINEFRAHGLIQPDLEKQGILKLQQGDKILASFRFAVDLRVGCQGLRLWYRAARGDGSWQRDMDYTIPVDEMRSHVRPARFYFLCPLYPKDSEFQCLRRCRKLYLPPGSAQFGCRDCHKLTYRSCQVSHEWDRFLRQFGVTTRQARRLGIL